MLNASKDLLRYLGLYDYAKLMEDAIKKTLSVDKVQTHDLGGSNSSDEVVETVKRNISDLLRTSDTKPF